MFIATKMACQAHVVLYDGRQSYASPAPPLSTGALVDLERIGQRLFISVLAVDIPLSQQPGSTISYDVIIDDGTPLGLFQLGLLGGSLTEVGSEHDPRRAEFPLGYDDGMLPSFVLPPSEPGDLRIVHASCRKPHGGGPKEADALQLVDAAISQAIHGTLSAATRPQQLILTGDQIYADDVPAGLLAALTAAGEDLLGWDEELPLIDSFRSFIVDPGWRTRYLSIRDVDLKELPEEDATDESASHLLRFGEWVAMYLFAWSDALWAVDSHGDYDLPRPPRVLPIAEALALAQKVLDLADTIGLVAVPARVARGLQAAVTLADWLTAFSKKTNEAWAETREKALRYGKSVRSIRRVLANCATYTMFDDHEVTDDWHVSKRVHDRLKGNGQPGPKGDVGPRLLRNGLSAYAIFQHWGNVPDDFGPGTNGRQLLDMWRYTGSPAGCAMKQTPRGGDTLLGIDPGDSPIPTSGARVDFVRMRWDYAVEFPAHRLIALDTRTWRFFPSGNPFSWSDLAPLIPNPPGSAATSGAAELHAVAEAWREAGAAAGVVVMGHFATVIDDYVGFATATGESLDQLRSRAAAAWTHFEMFVAALPGRAATAVADLNDPVSGFLHQFFSTPNIIAAAGSTVEELRDAVLNTMHEAAEFDFGPLSYDINAVFEALADFVDTAWSGSVVGMVHSAHRAAQHAGTDLWNLFTTTSTSHSAFTNLAVALVVSLDALDALTQTTGLDQLGAAIFRNGDNRVAPGLIRRDALPFMVTEPLRTIGPAAPVTILLSPAPIFGNRLMEMAQRLLVVQATATGAAGEEKWDFEPWSGNVPAMIDLFEAASSLRCAIVLSGDVHYAGSSVVRVIVRASEQREGQEERRGAHTRYIQFTSSSARNSAEVLRRLVRLDDLLYDEHGKVFFEQSDWASLMAHGSSALTHLENLARARVEEALEDALNAANPIRIWEDFLASPMRIPTTQDVLDAVMRVSMAPPNTVRAMANEAMWQFAAAIQTILEFGDDPLLKIFGDFLSAPAPIRRHLRDFYQAVGLDPANGLTREESVLVDRRSPRLSFYPVETRYAASPRAATDIEAAHRRTVGHANAGFISFKVRGADITEVVHELRWYPHDEPERLDPIPRTDWYGTLHRAGWHPFAFDAARDRPFDPARDRP